MEMFITNDQINLAVAMFQDGYNLAAISRATNLALIDVQHIIDRWGEA